MSIKIAERLKPFSHVPGVSCMLPKSTVVVQVFPTLLRIEGAPDIFLEVEGPVRDFTVQQDLEIGKILVHGHARNGYIRYTITQEILGIYVRFDKFPFAKESIFIPRSSSEIASCLERLSLGMHKAQDFEMMRRRSDLKEIFPLWLKIANDLPEISFTPCSTGTPLLLYACEEKIARKDREGVYETFLNLFHAGFYDMLVPRLFDNQFQGLVTSVADLKFPPYALLKEGGRLIRSLFFQETEDFLSLLPCLPIEFHSGRYLNLKTHHNDEIDLEWSKKMLQKVIIRPKSTRTFQLHIPKGIKSYRLRTSLKAKGCAKTASAPFDLDATTHPILILDRFQK
jgi:hypothetical protein